MTPKWTATALVLANLAAAGILAAVVWESDLLALAAIFALLAIIADSLGAIGGRVNVRTAVTPTRMPEGGQATVTVGCTLSRRQQARIELAPAMEILQGSNLVDGTNQDLQVTTRVRGPHAVGPVHVRTWSPLRLWASQQSHDAPITLEVIPRTTQPELALKSKVVTPIQGRFQVSRPGQGFDFFTLREYHAGDTMRSINWKATARRDNLIVNQRQTETLGETTILLDARSVMGLGVPGATPLDQGCRVALGLFADALANRDTVHFAAWGATVEQAPPVRTDRMSHLENLLAGLPAAGGMQFQQAWDAIRSQIRSKTGPVIVISSGEADPSMAPTVQRIAAEGHAVVVLLPDVNDGLELPGRRQARAKAQDEIRDAGADVVELSAAGGVA